MARKIQRIRVVDSATKQPVKKVVKESEKPDVLETASVDETVESKEETEKVGDVCILALARDEEKFLDEWINWNLKLGFDHIFILDNNPKGKELRISNFNVTVIPYNGIEFNVFNEDQCKAYNFALDYIKKLNYDYISVIDIDEFLDIKGLTIKKFIETYIVDKGLNMCEVLWKTYSDNNIIYERDCKPSVVETYTEEVTTMYYDNYDRSTSNEISWGKPIMKMLPQLEYGTNPHIPTDNVFTKYYKTEILPRSIANLKHYRTKCLETYISHKVMKAKANIANFTKQGRNIVDGYFLFNEKSKEKALAFLRLAKEYGYELTEDDRRSLYRILKEYKEKIALCCIAKNENKYILEWVKHYRKLGFDKIIIYDNNDISGEFLEEVLSGYVREGFVEIINFRGKTVRAQQKAYEDCYRRYGDKYDWIAFFDCDEFLELTTTENVKEYLSKKVFMDFDIIKINWETYTDSGQLYYEDKPVVERFTERYSKGVPEWSYDFHIKSVIRGGLKQTIVWETSHSPSLHTLPTCDNCGEKIIVWKYTNNGKTEYDTSFNVNVNYKMAKLKHYTTKSLEEYCNKIKRGYPDRAYGHNFDDLNTKKYFEVNEETNKKRIMFKNILGTRTIPTGG